MPQQDNIAVKIPLTDLEEIQAAIDTLTSKLMPHLKVLTVHERMELPKMGDKTMAFVQKALEYSELNQALVPTFLNVEALATDIQAVTKLRSLSQQLNPVVDALNDSMTLSGSEAYQGALVFYNNLKNAVRAKAPNAGTIYDDLSARFPGRGSPRRVPGV